MFSKKIIRRNKNVIRKIKICIFLTFLLSIGIFFGYEKFFTKRYDFLSPISSFQTNVPTFYPTNNSLNKNKDISLLETLLKKSAISYESIGVSSQEAALLVVLKDEENVIISRNKDLKEQISSLQLILSRFTIEGKKFSRLDFRFERPVVVFKNTK